MTRNRPLPGTTRSWACATPLSGGAVTIWEELPPLLDTPLHVHTALGGHLQQDDRGTELQALTLIPTEGVRQAVHQPTFGWSEARLIRRRALSAWSRTWSAT